MTTTTVRDLRGSTFPTAVSQAPRPAGILRLEAGAMAAAALGAYAAYDMSWALLAALILAPDLGLLGYLKGPRLGAHAYNLTHNLVLPVALAAVGSLTATPDALAVALIWIAHIGIDRAVGYGLKYPDEARRTHLQRMPG